MTVDGGKLHEGVWLPEDEVHLIGMMTPSTKKFARLPDGRASYQRHKYLAALDLVQFSTVFVDIGAHVGLWSMQAAQDFSKIVAFEPHPLHAALWRKNMGECEFATLHETALGDRAGSVSLATATPGSSGDTHVVGDGDIPMVTLDSFALDRIDLMKIDTEGYELPILRGAEQTVLRCRPVVVVEQKGRDAMYHGGKAGEALDYLCGLGMRDLRTPISGDYFLGW